MEGGQHRSLHGAGCSRNHPNGIYEIRGRAGSEAHVVRRTDVRGGSFLAEAAAEDLMATRFASPMVVTELDLRYLRKAQIGPVRTRTQLLGTGPDAPIQVEVIDTSTDQITTLAYARAAPVS